ncbi:MAG: DUF3467 domain-containing protein [bacterium]|nr:DUF3467 domain-containing protein [bacterium]
MSNGVTPPQAPGQQVTIELDEKIGEGIYSNLVLITHSNAEFVLDFTRLLPGLPKAKVQSRIILAPPHAKALLNALEENIKRYEEQFGTIQAGGAQGDRQFGFK